MNQQTPFILPFTAIRATDLPLVGGKGANLGEMAHAGFPVPPGFCLTTAVFQQFIAACPTADNLYTLLDSVTDVETARQVGQQVRETLTAVPIPPTIAAAVREEWGRLGTAQPYAVRSSATAEDLPDASFAGQQDTYLNVIGEEALLDAIRRCWVSLFTDRAILYRVQNNFPHRDVQLSVVMQQMVMAETSGILFTADPLTGHRHTVTIDASFGLGEALVSGIVSPDAYRVDKRTMRIIGREIADKQIAIFPEKEGGVRQEKLNDAQRTQTVLTDAEILALAAMGANAENHYGTPQDIEWAMADGRLYLLQARPITSLYPIDNLQSPDGTLRLFYSMGHQQMMTNTMSPLGMSTILTLAPIGSRPNGIESDIARAQGGRLFADLTEPLRHPIFRRIVLSGSSRFDALAPEIMKQVIQREEFQHKSKLHFSFANGRWVLGMVKQVLSTLWFENLDGFYQRANAVLDEDVAEKRVQLNAIATGEAQLRAIVQTMPTFLHAALFWIPKFIAGAMADQLIERMAAGWADPSAMETYNLGLFGNAVTDMNLELGDLADVARQSPQLTALFTDLGNDSGAWLQKAAEIEDSTPFFAAWDAFIARYGARGPSEIDISALRWYEEPLPLLQVVASYLQQEKGSHRIQHDKLAAARETAVSTLLTQAKHGLFGAMRVRLLRRLLHVSHNAGVMREHHKLLVIQHLRTVKEIVKKTAVDLTNAGKLTQPDDVWFLTWPELVALYSENSPHVAALIAKRRADWLRYAKLTPPAIITSDGETPVVQYHVADLPPDALAGNPVSPGVVEGVVHVIHDPQMETLEPGEILVAPFTDPGWTPLFINAGGLIMEVGGNLTHGSVVAREYGIPAVVGVRGATTTLQTGQRVRVDGNRGVVEIL